MKTVWCRRGAGWVPTGQFCCESGPPLGSFLVPVGEHGWGLSSVLSLCGSLVRAWGRIMGRNVGACGRGLSPCCVKKTVQTEQHTLAFSLKSLPLVNQPDTSRLFLRQKTLIQLHEHCYHSGKKSQLFISLMMYDEVSYSPYSPRSSNRLPPKCPLTPSVLMADLSPWVPSCLVMPSVERLGKPAGFGVSTESLER